MMDRREKEHLAEVRERIASRLEERQKELATFGQEITDALLHEWDVQPRHVRTFEDLIAMSQARSESLAAQSRYRELLLEIYHLRYMLGSAYFARCDFRYAGDAQATPVYIGRHAFIDAEARRSYVTDWRAPVASLYYEHGLGPASYPAPQGEMNGELTRKRQYLIRDGELLQAYDAETGLHDEILGAALSGAAGSRLKPIVETIQREQYEVIRRPEGRNLIIRGPAGSGKTSVGLHRLAFLLYRGRGRLRPADVLVLSANRLYHSYISGILPELEEEDVTRRLMADQLQPLLPEGVRLETQVTQTERLLGDSREAALRLAVARLLCSAEYLDQLTEYCRNLHLWLPDLVYRGQRILEGRELARLSLLDAADQALPARLRRIEFLVRSTFENYFLENRAEIEKQIDRGLDEVPNRRRIREKAEQQLEQSIAGAMRRISDGNRLNDREIGWLVLRACLRRDDASVSRGAGDGAVGGDRTAPSAGHGAARGERADRGAVGDDRTGNDAGDGGSSSRGRLSPSDLMAYLRRAMDQAECPLEVGLLRIHIRQLLGQVPEDRRLRLLLLDEAQDYSRLHLSILRKLYPQAAMILLTDPNQALLPELSAGSTEDMAGIIGADPERDRVILNKTYRSSGPINRYAAQWLRQEHPPSGYERPGPDPEVIRTTDPASAVRGVLPQEVPEDRNIGIIVRTMEDARRLHRKLGRGDVLLFLEPDDELPAPVKLLPAALAKGLEFDEAIVVFDGSRERPGQPLSRSESNLRYVQSTRALHRLTVIIDETEHQHAV